jgi:hypothetical protein
MDQEHRQRLEARIWAERQRRGKGRAAADVQVQVPRIDRSLYRAQIEHLARECDLGWLVRQQILEAGRDLREFEDTELAMLLGMMEYEIECRQNGVDSGQYRPVTRRWHAKCTTG